jgi:DMSO/TMAO reductase YedYZ heme-binding membrane subunit
MSKIPWYVARSSGLVAWALIVVTIVWGLLLATRVLGRKPTPAWLLSLHRYLGALTLVFVGVHVGGILLDSYTNFGLVDVLVPFTGTWHPLAVALGIVGMYLLVAIEVTSLLRHRISNRVWHGIHLLSYLLFALTTVHMLTAGTDVKAILATGSAILVGTVATFGAAALYLWRSDPGEPKAPARPHAAGRRTPTHGSTGRVAVSRAVPSGGAQQPPPRASRAAPRR